MRFWVRVTPRARDERVDGVGPDGALHVHVRAAPADGAANNAVLRLLAETLSAPRSTVHLVAGATARRKLIEVTGVAAERAGARWPALARSDESA